MRLRGQLKFSKNLKAAFAVSLDRKVIKPIKGNILTTRKPMPRVRRPLVKQFKLFNPASCWQDTSNKSKTSPLNLILLMTAISGVAAQALIERENSTSEVISKGSICEIVDENPNLLEYPVDKSHPFNENCQITIGDLHGNALKLIYFLVRQNVLDLNENDYKELVTIYQKPANDLTISDLKNFETLLDRAKFHTIPKGALIRIIGDELADRGSNDYFTLKIFEKMTMNNVPFEILFSNHGYEFIKVYEQGLLENFSYLEKHEGMAISLTNLRLLVEKQLVSMEEIHHLVEQCYQPHLKLLGCSMQVQTNPWTFLQSLINLNSDIDEQKENFTLYSHAPIGINTIKAIAVREGIAYSDENPLSLVTTVNKINSQFSSVVTHNQVLKTYGPELQLKGSVRDISLDAPILRTIWSRGHQEKDVPVRTINKFNLFYVHGHDGGGEVDPCYKNYIINLDNSFGKGTGREKNKYSIAYTHEKRASL